MVMALSMVLTIAFTMCVYAAGSSGWVDRSKLEIYKPAGTLWEDSGLDDFLATLGSAANEILSTVMGILIGPLIVGLADTLYFIMSSVGVSLDTLIFGRVGGMAATSMGNMFTFGLEDGNVFGTVAMAVYTAVLGLFIIIAIIVMIFKLVKLLYVTNDPRNRNDLKSAALSAVICLSLMYLMPKLLDVFMLFRDYILYGVANKGTELIVTAAGGSGGGIGTMSRYFANGSDLSLQELYRNSYLTSPTFFNAVMYLATVILTLYFAFTYAAIAFSFALMVVLFPLTAILDMSMGGDRVKQWIVDVLGLMIIPVIDAVLLLFPLAIGILSEGGGTGYDFIRFIVCISIIPARKFIRNKLGVGGATGLEGSGLGAAMGAIRLGSSLVRGVGGLMSGALAGRKSAEDMKQSAGAAAAEAAANEAQGASIIKDFAKRTMGLNGDEKVAKAGYKPVDMDSVKANTSGAKTSEERNVARASAVRDTVESAKTAEDNLVRERDEAEKNHNNELASMQKGIDERTQKANAIRESIDRDKRALSAIPKVQSGKKPEEMSVEEFASERERDKLEGRIKENSARLNELNEQNSKARGEMSEKQRRFGETKAQYAASIKSVRDIQKEGAEGIRNLSRVGGDTDLQKQRLFDKMANVDNYELPEVRRNLSNERLAELRLGHSQKIADDAKRATMYGTVGTVGGLAAGATASVMTGPTGMLVGASLGTDLGGMIAKYKADSKALKTGRDYSGSRLYDNTVYSSPSADSASYEAYREDGRNMALPKPAGEAESDVYVTREAEERTRTMHVVDGGDNIETKIVNESRKGFVPNESIESFDIGANAEAVTVNSPNISPANDSPDAIIENARRTLEDATSALSSSKGIRVDGMADIGKAVIAQDPGYASECFTKGFEKAASVVDAFAEMSYYYNSNELNAKMMEKSGGALREDASYEENVALASACTMGDTVADMIMRSDFARQLPYDEQFTRSVLRDSIRQIVIDRSMEPLTEYARGRMVDPGRIPLDYIAKEQNAS